MANAPNENLWSDDWTPWPGDEDNEAKQIWLKNKSNHNFSAWVTAIGDQLKHWYGLEKSICSITGLPLARCSKLGKQAVREIVDGEASYNG